MLDLDVLKREKKEKYQIQTDLEKAVRYLKNNNQLSILFDEFKIKPILEQLNVSAKEIDELIIVKDIKGYYSFIFNDNEYIQAKLQRFMYNALNQSKLSNTKIMNLIKQLACGLEIPFEYHEYFVNDIKEPVVSNNTYDNELLAIYANEMEFILKHPNHKPDEETLKRLQEVAKTGNPTAQYVLGLYFIKKSCYELNYISSYDSSDEVVKRVLDACAKTYKSMENAGVLMLQGAADAGYSSAYTQLGNYYYEKQTTSEWGKAFDLYCGIGMPSGSDQFRFRILKILEQKELNRNILNNCFKLAFLLLIVIAIHPGGRVFYHSLTIDLSFLLLLSMTVGKLYFSYKKNQYKDWRYMPIIIFLIAMAYLLCRTF